MWQFNVLLVRALKLLDYDLSFRNTFLNVSTFYSSAGDKMRFGRIEKRKQETAQNLTDTSATFSKPLRQKSSPILAIKVIATRMRFV